MDSIPDNEQNKVFPIVMPKQMAKTLKQVALQQDRSASDIVRVLISEFFSARLDQKSSYTTREVY